MAYGAVKLVSCDRTDETEMDVGEFRFVFTDVDDRKVVGGEVPKEALRYDA